MAESIDITNFVFLSDIFIVAYMKKYKAGGRKIIKT